jgi:hypothetical protein
MDGAQINTPADLERKAREGKQPKPVIQSTEKILFHELMELGLDEWMEKDRSTSEYRKAVDQARARRREWNKLQTLAERGIKVPQAMEKVQSPSSTFPLPAASIEIPNAVDSAQACAPSLAQESGGEPKAQDKSETPDPVGIFTRKRRRLHDIRRRDALAQAAMERDD